jgi:hypothetical protein
VIDKAMQVLHAFSEASPELPAQTVPRHFKPSCASGAPMLHSTGGSKPMLAHADLRLLDSIVKDLVAETITSWHNFDRNWRRFAARVMPGTHEENTVGVGAAQLRSSIPPADSLCNFRSLSADRCQ